MEKRELRAKSCRREWIVSEVWSVCVVVVRRERAFGVACVVSCRGESRVILPLQGPERPTRRPPLRRFYSCARDARAPPRNGNATMAIYSCFVLYRAATTRIQRRFQFTDRCYCSRAGQQRCAAARSCFAIAAFATAIAAANAINGIDRRRANSGAISSYSSTRP